ncbi:hypothetical protein Tco_0193721 [Tanacetum coccineum]
MICDESWKIHDASLITETNNKSFKINDLKAQLQEKSIVVNELKQLVATLNDISHVTSGDLPDLDSRFQKMEDKNVSLASPLPKTQFILKVVEKNDLSKIVTSHLHTNKIIEKWTKVLAPCLIKIKSELINAYFKNNKAVHRDYLQVTKKHVETLQELLEQARALKLLDENLVFTCKFAERIRELLVYVSASCPFTQSRNEKWAPATSHRKNNKPYVDASKLNQTVIHNTQKHAVKQNTQKTNNTLLPSTGRVSYTDVSGSKPRSNSKNNRIQ